jgi:hypothetical protein
VNNTSQLITLLLPLILTNAQAIFFDKYRDGTFINNPDTDSSSVINNNQKKQGLFSNDRIIYRTICYLEPRIMDCVIIKDNKVASKC